VYEVREIALMEKRIQASLYYQLRMWSLDLETTHLERRIPWQCR
jgi:hypothetical protein